MKIFKRLLLGLTILAILLVGGIFLAVNLIDPNDYKEKIQSLAMEKTGRVLSINGDIGLSYFPWAGLSIGEIAMANPESFGDTPFVQIDSAQVKVELLPLLKKSVSIDTIELDGLSLDLQRAADGTTNWDDLVAAGTTTSESSESDSIQNTPENTSTDAASASAGLQDLKIGAIAINDAQINWQDKQNNTDALLSNFNLSSGRVELATPFSVKTDFSILSNSIGLKASVNGAGEINVDPRKQIYQINQLQLATSATGDALPMNEMTVDIKGNVIANLEKQTATLRALSVSTAGVELSGDVDVTDLQGNPTIQSALQSNTFNPREVAEKLNLALPPTSDSRVLKSASVRMNLSGSAQSATLSDILITLDDTKFNGSTRLPDLTRPVPPVEFALTLDAIDLDRYLPETSNSQSTTPANSDTLPGTGTDATTGTSASAEAPTANDDAPIDLPVDLLKQLEVDGIFKVGTFRISNLTTSDIEIPVTAKAGKISLTDIKAVLYEGTLASNASLDVSTPDPVYTFSSEINQVQAEPMLQDLLQGTAPISGTAVISSSLETSGDTVKQLTNNLNGKYVSDFTDGALNGFNIGYQLRRAKSLFSSATSISAVPVSKTDFSALHVSALIDNGVIRSDDLDIRAPALRISGAGTVSLPEELVDYTIVPKVVDSVEGQGGKELDDLKGIAASIPVQGTFEELSNDFTGTVFAAMKKDFSNRAEEAAKALVSKERDKIKADAKAKAELARQRAQEKLKAEQTRARQRAEEELAAQKEKVQQAAEDIKERAKDELKNLFK